MDHDGLVGSGTLQIATAVAGKGFALATSPLGYWRGRYLQEWHCIGSHLGVELWFIVACKAVDRTETVGE